MLLILGLAAEAGTRYMIRQQIASRGGLSGVDVSLGPVPVLWQLATGHLQDVRLHGDRTTFGRITDVGLDARLQDVRRSDGATRIGHFTARLVLPADAIAGALSGENGSGRLAVGTDPAAGTLTFGVGPVAEVVVRPTLTDGRPRFDLVSVTVRGRPAPDSLRTLMEDRLAAQSPFGGDVPDRGPGGMSLPEGVAFTALGVTVDGLRLSLAGSNVTVRAEQSARRSLCGGSGARTAACDDKAAVAAFAAGFCCSAELGGTAGESPSGRLPLLTRAEPGIPRVLGE